MTVFDKRTTVIRGIAGAVIFLLVASITKGFAMSLLKHPEEEIVLSSPFEGVITLVGKPVEGAKVVRVLTWFETESVTDSAVTDEAGKFSLPAVKKNLSLNKIGEFVVSQEMVVLLAGKEYLIWTKAKWEKGLYGELSGRPKDFRCELSDEFKLVEAGKGMLATVCKWSGINEG